VAEVQFEVQPLYLREVPEETTTDVRIVGVPVETGVGHVPDTRLKGRRLNMYRCGELN
jgi:hypothetical protein